MSLIPALFNPDIFNEDAGAKWVFNAQHGCGVKLYPNPTNSGSSKRKIRHLFWEVASCTVDRTITDIGGSFTLVLNGTEPWDELIQPDDFVRIFMGDQIVQSKHPKSAFNFATGSVGLSQSLSPIPNKSVVFVPVPDSGKGSGILSFLSPPGGSSNKKSFSYLTMYERFIGKVDRVERSAGPPTATGGSQTTFTISGRSYGAIIQDISLYYNEWLPGLNSINIFFDSDVSIENSPDGFIQEVLSVVLSAVPLPQWLLPAELIKDMNYTTSEGINIQVQNLALVNKQLAKFKQRLSQSSTQGEKANVANSANTVEELTRLINEIGIAPATSPFMILSTLGINPCFGSTLNRSFLNSQTTGLFDMLKGLSNDGWNEFFIDLCPDGDPEGGLTTSAINVPTVVMRQRPYDMTQEMLNNVADYIKPDADSVSKFPVVDYQDINSSLFDLSDNAVTILGPLAQSDIEKALVSFGLIGSPMFQAKNFSPSMMDYQMGISSHERLNAFLALGSQNFGQGTQNDRILQSANGGFFVDTDSINRYGFRIIELTTQYAQVADSKSSGTSQFVPKPEALKKFSGWLANWYFLNHVFLNGRIVSRFLPQARLGIPYKYFETRITNQNPYPKLEVGYVQGVTDNFVFGQGLTTTITGTRGIRYNLGKNSTALSEAFSSMGAATAGVSASFA